MTDSEPVDVILSAAELQAVEDFTGTPGTQDPRRWWMALEMAGRLSTVGKAEDYPARVLKLFDMKMSGEAAVWADDTPEVADLVQTSSGTMEHVKSLKLLFLARFKKTTPRSNDLNRDLEDLQQGVSESLEEYHTRARRILVQICEDSTVNGVERTMSKAESQWVMTVVSRFTRGLSERWVEFQVSEAEPSSLEKAYSIAKEQTRKFQRYVQKSAEWRREGYDLPVFGNPFGGPVVGPQFQPLARNYHSDPQGARPPTSLPRQPHPLNGPPGMGGYRSDPTPAQAAQQYAKPPGPGSSSWGQDGGGAAGRQESGPLGPTIPLQSSTPVVPPRNPSSGPRPNSGYPRSLNSYVNGATAYRADHRNPLCVSCGVTGHLPKNCRNPPLTAWEREKLRAIVFPENLYQNSRSARLFRAGLEISDREAQEEDDRLYTQLGYTSSEGEVSQEMEAVGSRLSQLELSDAGSEERTREVEPQSMASRAARQDGAGEVPAIKPYRTVSIDDLLQGSKGARSSNKRQDRSGSSGIDRPMSKKERLGDPVTRLTKQLPARKGGVAVGKKVRQTRKKVAEMTELEKAEREAKKGVRKQLKMIKGMEGEKRFDLAKALANTPCPISWLQYFQDSPVARQEMSRITSLTSNLVAAMFGDTTSNVRVSALAGLDSGVGTLPIDRPRLGENGAFMVTAVVGNGDPEGPSFSTSKVCVDAGSECDLVTPDMVRKAEGEVIPMDETPWPTLSIRTSSGACARLLGIARIRVNVHGIDRIVYACVIPPNFAASSGYDLLLGVPWLYEVNGRINVGDGTVSVFNDRTQADVVIDTGRFTPPNFKVMFDRSNKQVSHDDSESEEYEDATSESEVSDSGEDSVKSSDAKPEGQRLVYPEIIRKYGKDPVVASRCATLVIEEEGNPACGAGREEVARIRYVTAEEYLSMYGSTGPYSHLAEAIRQVEAEVEEEGDDMLVIDSEDRWGQRVREYAKEAVGQGFRRGEILTN